MAHIKIPQEWTVTDGIAFIYIERRNGSRHKVIASPEDVDVLGQYRWCLCGKGYVWTHWARDDGRHVSMHSIVAERHIDHINHNPLDNRRENLRICTHQQNQMNKAASKNKIVKYKGVTVETHLKKKPFRAIINVCGKKRCLGRHATALKAALIYDAAALEYHGEFACTNKMLGLL